jgi:hypothetical protein
MMPRRQTRKITGIEKTPFGWTLRQKVLMPKVQYRKNRMGFVESFTSSKKLQWMNNPQASSRFPFKIRRKK